MSQEIRKYFVDVSSGTNDTMRKINQEKIKKINVPLPDIDEQEKLVKKSNAFKANLREISEEVDRLIKITNTIEQSAIDSIIN